MDTSLVEEAKRVVSLGNDDRLDGMEALFEKAGFRERCPGKHDLAEWSELTPEQQAIVRVVAAFPEAAGAVGWGVPRRPRELQRFAGILPPGPLESAGPGGKPRWRVLDELIKTKTPWDDALQHALGDLSKVDYMRALFDLASFGYKLTQNAKACIAPDQPREAQLAAGKDGWPFVVELLERRLENRDDPMVESYLGERMDLMVTTLEEMGAPIDPRWRNADW